MKGQYFSFDALIAALIFLIGFMTLYSYWNFLQSEGVNSIEMLRKEALRMSVLLFADKSTTYGIMEDPRSNLVNRSVIGRKAHNLAKTSKFCLKLKSITCNIDVDTCRQGVKERVKYTLYRPIRCNTGFGVISSVLEITVADVG